MKTHRSTLLSIFLPLLILSVAICVTVHLIQSAPNPAKRPSSQKAITVTTMPLTLARHETSIMVMGTVTPAQSIQLRPQINGEIIALGKTFRPGGSFQKKDILLQIEPKDYELILQQQQSAVEQAQNDIELENGNQIVAQRELSLLGEHVSNEEKRLMLREPQLHSLQTALKIAESKRQQAALNLQRTTITAPFNGMVQTRDVTIGAWISTTTSVATLIGTDAFWVEASVPEKDLDWIIFPQHDQPGSSVVISNPTSWGPTLSREGQVIQLLPTLESESRMATVLIEVDDPLALYPPHQGRPKLLVGSFVHLSIAGKPLLHSLELPRKDLHDGQTIWLLSSQQTLEIRTVHIAFTSAETVLITGGIQEGEQIITSPIATPIAGMQLSHIPQTDAISKNKSSTSAPKTPQ